jgi:hypothetical protein
MGRDMTWRIVQASSRGTSHITNGEECQDDCFGGTVQDPNGQEFFIGVVTDGAGSALHGKKGAEIACRSGIEIIESWIIDQYAITDLTEDIITGWVIEIRNALVNSAHAEQLIPRDYACTLLGAVIGLTVSAYFQIGDGAIVISDNESYAPVFWPDEGEYVNTTHFVTDDDAISFLQKRVSLHPPEEIAIFTDGLQRLALLYENRTAHKPFFDPMFKVLRETKAMSCDILSDQLARFLSSDAVNQRTDDDKTLILSTRKMSDSYLKET